MQGHLPHYLLLAVSCLLSGTDGTRDDELRERQARLTEALPRMAARAAVPGLSLAIADAQGVTWSTAHGACDAATGAAVDRDTVFEAASLSKPVFAYAVLQLVGEGVLELDTPLVEYAPLEDIAHDPRHRLVTARMVLSHTTGLPNWRPRGGPDRRLAFEADPGSAWRYSGEGFVLLQRVVEELVGDTLQGLAQSLVFEPLGMTRSSFVWNPAFADNVAFPHDTDGNSERYRQVSDPNAAGGLLTTASDYARFLSALLRGEGLDEELHRALLRPAVQVNDGVAWGLGVGLEENPDGLAFWHWGHNGGYRSYTIAYPSRGLAVVYFTNSDNGMRFLRDVVELATGDQDHPAIDHLDYPSYPPLETPEKPR